MLVVTLLIQVSYLLDVNGFWYCCAGASRVGCPVCDEPPL